MLTGYLFSSTEDTNKTRRSDLFASFSPIWLIPSWERSEGTTSRSRFLAPPFTSSAHITLFISAAFSAESKHIHHFSPFTSRFSVSFRRSELDSAPHATHCRLYSPLHEQGRGGAGSTAPRDPSCMPCFTLLRGDISPLSFLISLRQRCLGPSARIPKMRRSRSQRANFPSPFPFSSIFLPDGQCAGIQVQQNVNITTTFPFPHSWTWKDFTKR